MLYVGMSTMFALFVLLGFPVGVGIGWTIRRVRVQRSDHPGYSCVEAVEIIEGLTLDRNPVPVEHRDLAWTHRVALG
jgi:hypothetical protein